MRRPSARPSRHWRGRYLQHHDDAGVIGAYAIILLALITCLYLVLHLIHALIDWQTTAPILRDVWQLTARGLVNFFWGE